MALRNIRVEDDPILKEVSRPVKEITPRVKVLLEDMIDTMDEAEGVGLAAPQVGILKRIVVIRIGKDLYQMINPEIIAQNGSQIDAEGCLSVPGKRGIVERPMEVTVRYMDENGNMQEKTGQGLLARAFCHEIDHLDGHLYTRLVEEYLADNEFYDPETDEIYIEE